MMMVITNYRRRAWQTMMVENDELRDAVFKRRMDLFKSVGENHQSVKAATNAGTIKATRDLLESSGFKFGQ